MKITINQETNGKIFRGEDKDFTIYIYDSKTFEPIDISSFDDISVCFKNENTTTATFVGTPTANPGQFTFPVTAAESLLLAVQTHAMHVNLNIVLGPVLNFEEFTNYIDVVDPIC